MPLSYLPAFLTSAFLDLADWLHKCSAARLPVLLVGILLARGRRTVTAWFRAAGVAEDYRPAYHTVCAVGRDVGHVALSALHAVRPLLGPRRLRVALDDTPTPRYGPQVEGCGTHHNPSPGPAGARYVFDIPSAPPSAPLNYREQIACEFRLVRQRAQHGGA